MERLPVARCGASTLPESSAPHLPSKLVLFRYPRKTKNWHVYPTQTFVNGWRPLLISHKTETLSTLVECDVGNKWRPPTGASSRANNEMRTLRTVFRSSVADRPSSMSPGTPIHARCKDCEILVLASRVVARTFAYSEASLRRIR